MFICGLRGNLRSSSSALIIRRFSYRSDASVLSGRKGINENIGLITLNDKRTFNALSSRLIQQLKSTLKRFDVDNSIAAIILTGSSKVFSSGASIMELLHLSYPDICYDKTFDDFMYILQVRKPIIAAVNGIAYGGGFELAMMCDIIYASENARFAQPEIKIGCIPGAGATQRLSRTAGKSFAMEFCLTAREMTALEAKQRKIISKVCRPDEVISEAVDLAEKIAEINPLYIARIKENANNESILL